MSSTRDATATFEGYLRGLFQSERATVLRMSEVNAVDHQSMPHMLTAGSVDWDGLGRQLALEANDGLGGNDAVLIFDDSGFAKKGAAAAGVARQWNGRLGKVDNGQVGVFATLCRGDRATLIDTRLSLPEAWCLDEARCKKAAIPQDKREFLSKSQLALAMLAVARQRGIQFGYVGIDGGYGKEPTFLRGVDEQGGRFVADVPCTQSIYLQDPEPLVPEWSGRGKKPVHRRPQGTAQRVDPWAAPQEPETWQRLTLREGEKGLWVADYLHALVWVWDGQEENARCWHLLARREVGAETISHDGLANAPLETPWQALARVQAQRCFIEHRFREAKSECGMADYQVRRWDAWPHHMALVMLGTLFLVKQKKAGRQQWPMLSFNDLVTALAHLLPRRQLTAEELADVINKRHELRQRTKESHARRSQVALE